MPPQHPSTSGHSHGHVFATTHWSAVLTAAKMVGPGSEAALEELCRSYWYPLYTYVRHRGYSPADAQDLTQEFFHRLLHKEWLRNISPLKGKFRSFLLACINHFLANEWDRTKALKRGGHIKFEALDSPEFERRHVVDSAAGFTPEQVYQRAWAMALLQRVLSRLRQECVAAHQVNRFEELKPILIGDRPSISYAVLASKLGISEAAVKMAVQRLRRRYAELLRAEISQTVGSQAEVEDELGFLRTVLSSR